MPDKADIIEKADSAQPRWKRRFADNREARRWNLTSLLLTLPLLLVSVYYYGPHILRTAAVAALTALVCEVAAGRLILRRQTGDDWNAIATGIWIAMMLPAELRPNNNIALYAAIGSAFAILVVKIPFGGTMHVPFTPAAAGFSSLAVCFPQIIFSYVPSSMAPPIHESSLAAMLQQGRSALEGRQLSGILLGNVVGPMGTCVILVILAVLVAQLFIKERRGAVLVSAGFLVTAAVLAFIFPRVVGQIPRPDTPLLQALVDFFPRTMGTALRTRLVSVGMELCAGSLFFAAVFLLPDPAIMPRRWYMRLAWGAMAAALCMLLRNIGIFEEGVCFAVLLADAFIPLFYRLQTELEDQERFRVRLRRSLTGVRNQDTGVRGQGTGVRGQDTGKV